MQSQANLIPYENRPVMVELIRLIKFKFIQFVILISMLDITGNVESSASTYHDTSTTVYA